MGHERSKDEVTRRAAVWIAREGPASVQAVVDEAQAVEIFALKTALRTVAESIDHALKRLDEGKVGSALMALMEAVAGTGRVSMIVARIHMLRELGAK